ncbi:MAG: hypothetical protein QOH14_4113, partial [Pseudonocardiales bacterium]|nr:hypothetical protein [Pseudonocardiales bacterium]
ALYDDQRQLINFPYYVDSVDLDIPDPGVWEPFGVGNARGTTAYLLRTGKPIIVSPERHAELVAAGEVEAVGVVGQGDWLGAPLTADGRTVGVVVCQTYRAEERHSTADRDLLAFVGQHIGSALTRVRAIEETRQRNAELALVNEIGQALAEQLEFEAIIELVGERVRSIFHARSIFIALYDSATNLISWPYDIDEGERFHRDPRELGPGLTSTVITTQRPLRIGTIAEQLAAGAIQIGGSDTQSWLGVPIVGANRVVGVVGLESIQSNAFSEADERLLATLANSMGVALENARLFDETKRLLAQTEQRNAELAVINDIGSALVDKLDLQSIIDLVGDRLVQTFPAPDMYIGLYDRATNLISFPYGIDRGVRAAGPPLEFGTGLSSRIISTRTPLRLGSVEEQVAHGGVYQPTSLGVDPNPSQSWLGVPILAGPEAIGLVSFGKPEPDAFSESDERVVSTIAASMGVALENARLFDETKRLLAETDERAAELAVINEIGAALASQLDFDAIVELVGERVRSIFASSSMWVGIYDTSTETISFPYGIENGQRYESAPIGLGPGVTGHVIRSRTPLNLRRAEDGDTYGVIRMGELTESWLGVPILAGDRVLGVIALESAERDAFDDADVRLLSTLATSMGVALENARLFDETKRLLGETNERAAELALINDVQHGLAEKLDMQAMYDLVGDRIQAIFDAQIVDIGVIDEESSTIHFPYTIERGVRYPDEPIPISGVRGHVIKTRKPLLINRDLVNIVPSFGQVLVMSGEAPRSALWAPLVVGNETRGVISLQNIDREDAFSESDVELLTTLASSLSVALENVRLIDETRQRLAELATVNEVGQALASQLDLDN